MKIDWEIPVIVLSITLSIVIFLGSMFAVTYFSKEQQYNCMELFADKSTVEIIQLCK